jgi:hypothetical protein
LNIEGKTNIFPRTFHPPEKKKKQKIFPPHFKTPKKKKKKKKKKKNARDQAVRNRRRSTPAFRARPRVDASCNSMPHRACGSRGNSAPAAAAWNRGGGAVDAVACFVFIF